MLSSNVRDDTRAVHAGREGLRRRGVHAPSIDLSNAYPLGDLDAATRSLEGLAGGANAAESPVYARLHNPGVALFEEALAALEGADGAVAFASGMAALSAVLLSMRELGRHVVAVRPLYGGTDHLLASGLLDLDVTFTAPERVAAARRGDTALVLLETPANPTLELVDIEEVVRQARGVPVVVDSTFATPVLQRPLRHGASLVLHSATKFLGGHGDVVGGIVAGDAGRIAALRRVRVLTGALLHPLAAYLLHRGLQTLGVRVRAAQHSAGILAARLLEHSAVERVRYPGLESGDPLGLIGRQMGGPGSLVSFDLCGGRAAAARLLGRLRRITHAVSLGSTDTLIQHPASLTHRLVPADERIASGVADGLVRLSVGLEDPEDLWEELSECLGHAAAAAPVALAGRNRDSGLDSGARSR